MYIHTVGVVLYLCMDNIKYANINIEYNDNIDKDIYIYLYALEDAI